MSPALALRDVAFEIDGEPLVRALSLDVRPGTLLAIVGPNGAGKSTLLRMIAGSLRGTGSIAIDGSDAHALSRRERSRSIAFVPADDVSLDDLTVWDVVAEGRHAHRKHAFDGAAEHDRAIAAALDRVGLETYRDRPFRELSSGERRRTWLALGLAQAAPILLLDEPTAHLDLRYAQQILRLMREIADGGHSIVCVLHDLNEAAQVADRITLIDRGRLACTGTPREVLTPATIARTYGVDCDVVATGADAIRIFARA